MSKFLAVLILGLALSNALLTDEAEWQNFKTQHHKLYQSGQEEAHRFQVFKDNLHQIQEHNAKYEKGQTTYRMGVNKFSDLTPEEFKEIYGRGVLPRNEENKPIYS